MILDEVKRKFQDAGFIIGKEQRLQTNLGTQLRLNNGAIVNVFDTGKCQIQGQHKEEVQKVLGDCPGQLHATINNKVFVVYGHDRQARDQLEAMLRRWGLEPLILDQLPSGGQTIIEKLEEHTGEVQYGVVLATPDDEGHRAGCVDEKKYRVRQNVVLELGMLLSRLGRGQVAILLKQQTNMEPPSDIQGLIYFSFGDDLAKDAGTSLAKEMASKGFDIDLKRL